MYDDTAEYNTIYFFTKNWQKLSVYFKTKTANNERTTVKPISMDRQWFYNASRQFMWRYSSRNSASHFPIITDVRTLGKRMTTLFTIVNDRKRTKRTNKLNLNMCIVNTFTSVYKTHDRTTISDFKSFTSFGYNITGSIINVKFALTMSKNYLYHWF